MEPKVSIIVPVYNAQEYLKRCVDSILSQDYRDFELLLMDDGSKDASGEICDAYAQQDGRVRVVHKENTGVSDTRRGERFFSFWTATTGSCRRRQGFWCVRWRNITATWSFPTFTGFPGKGWRRRATSKRTR